MGENTVRPGENDVRQIVRSALSEEVAAISRFPTGLVHRVYDVTCASGRQVVVRIARPQNEAILDNGLYWSRLLRPKGVPLPQILAHDLTNPSTPFPYMILHRLPGNDLGLVYRDLNADQKKAIAQELIKIQNIVATLPRGAGFGHVARYDRPYPYPTWAAVVRGSLIRSRARLQSSGLVDLAVVDLVESRLEQFEAYFDEVPPVPFLDDITAKNVIVHDGKLSGIVDVDWIGFGDHTSVLALTRMSLMALGYPTDYVDYWAEALRLTGEQHRVLDIYTAACCLDFISDVTSTKKRDGLQTILSHLLSEL